MKTTNQEIEEILQTEWPSTEHQLRPPPQFVPGVVPNFENAIWWESRLTPGLPAEWPIRPNGELIYYAYAAGRQYKLVDGEWFTVPCARFVLTPRDSTLKFERLAEKPRVVGSQGMWPLRSHEVVLFDESRVMFEEFVEAFREQGEIPPGPLMEKIKRG